MIFIKYDEYGHISQTQNITESIGQNSLKANTLYIAFPNVVQSYISMIKEYKCYITFKRSDGIKISDLPCSPVSKTIDGIEYFGYLYSFSSKQVTACAGSLIVSPRLFSINSDGEETIAVIGANQTLNVSPSVVESEVVSNLSEAEKNALVDMIQNQQIMWLEKKYNNFSAIEVFTSLLENSMSDGIYVSFDRKRLFVYERTTESICFGEFIKNGIVKNETGIYKYDNEENFEYIKIDDLKTGNLSDLPFTANSIVEALNKIIDGTELVGKAISADYAETASNAYRDSEDNLIATYYASKSALSQANKEIANLKEALYGYVLDTADVEIEKDIPYTTTIGSNTYNLVDNVYGLIKEVRGNTIKSENLLVLDDVAETTTNGITYSIKNGVITLNGTCTESFNINIGTNTEFNDVMLGIFGNIDGYVSIRSWNISWSGDSDKIYSNNFKHMDSVYNIRLEVENATYNNIQIKPMLVKGTTAPTEFKQGFNGLKSVEYNGLNIVGANLLNIADKEPTTTNGITYSIKNGVLTINGTSTSNTTLHIGKLSVKLNDTFKVKTFNSNVYFQYALYNGDNWLSTSGKFQDSATIQVTNEKANTLELLVFIATGETISNSVAKPMLVKGNVAPTTFKPYKTPSYILDNFYDTELILRGVGSAKDKIVISKNTDNDYYTATKITNIGEVDLGTLTWTYVNDGTYPLFISQKIDTKTYYENNEFNGIMSKYESTKYSYSGNAYKGMSKNGTFTIRAHQQDIMIQDYSYTDATTFKTSLSGVKLQYELAIPTTEVLSTTLTDSDVMPLLELGGSIEVGESEVKGSTIIEMVYRLSGINPTATTEVTNNE